MDFHSNMGADQQKSSAATAREAMQQAAQLIGRQITAGLKGGCAKWAAVAAEKIKGHLTAGEPKEAWQSLKG
jgi:hypothetical protein